MELGGHLTAPTALARKPDKSIAHIQSPGGGRPEISTPAESSRASMECLTAHDRACHHQYDHADRL
jgi:hypothetical protein